ncbi:hypothetical protein FIBSPDRAFT_873955, partial [Athelia psychrophila]
MHTRARDDCRRRRTAAVLVGMGICPRSESFPLHNAQSTSNPPSASDEAPQAHLCTRVARSKSENRQQASALRRPPAGSLGRLRGRRRSHRAAASLGAQPAWKPSPSPPPTTIRLNSTRTPNAHAGPREHVARYRAHIRVRPQAEPARLPRASVAEQRYAASAGLSAASVGTVRTQRSSGSG